MSQRTRILTEIWGFRGWRVTSAHFEGSDGGRVEWSARNPQPYSTLVLCVERGWKPRCSTCGALCRVTHARLGARRWRDLPWASHSVEIEARPIRVVCHGCGERPAELLGWAEPYQRQTCRLQQHLALQAASMPVMHVGVLYGLSWSTVRRAEGWALERWAATRAPVPLCQVGIDEKFIGRRHKRAYRFVTIVSNLETGEPLWMGPGRDEGTVATWLASLRPAEKQRIKLFAMDMHRPFWNAVRGDLDLIHADVVHDPFHVMKRAGEAVNEIRKDTFFRAGEELRTAGRGTRWLVLRAWDRCTPARQAELARILSFNRQLARAYQVVEELRAVLHAPDRESMETGLDRILRRTQARRHRHLRKLHDSLLAHWEEIVALGEHRPATGRTEALNNNWETLVRRARGYRDYDYLLLKLRFMTANPVRTESGTQRFLALGMEPPARKAA